MAAVACTLTGCAPQVVTDMFSTDYPPTSADSVRVFLMGENTPNKSVAIGTVKVVDNGLSVNCRVLTMSNIWPISRHNRM